MIFDKQGATTTILQENISLPLFIHNISDAYTKLRHDNIIINLFPFEELTPEDILGFLQLSNQHRSAGRSFVLVTNKVSYDEVSHEICLVPTLQEAKDIIEMEEIERDLGL